MRRPGPAGSTARPAGVRRDERGGDGPGPAGALTSDAHRDAPAPVGPTRRSSSRSAPPPPRRGASGGGSSGRPAPGVDVDAPGCRRPGHGRSARRRGCGPRPARLQGAPASVASSCLCHLSQISGRPAYRDRCASAAARRPGGCRRWSRSRPLGLLAGGRRFGTGRRERAAGARNSRPVGPACTERLTARLVVLVLFEQYSGPVASPADGVPRRAGTTRPGCSRSGTSPAGQRTQGRHAPDRPSPRGRESGGGTSH